MAYKQHSSSVISMHTILVGVTLIGSMSLLIQAADTSQETTSPANANTRIIQFRDANFSTWNEKVKYNSTAMKNPKGMEPLYNITNIILDFFIGKKPIPDGK